jgi:hypothetical protein
MLLPEDDAERAAAGGLLWQMIRFRWNRSAYRWIKVFIEDNTLACSAQPQNLSVSVCVDILMRGVFG